MNRARRYMAHQTRRHGFVMYEPYSGRWIAWPPPHLGYDGDPKFAGTLREAKRVVEDDMPSLPDAY